MNKILKKGFAVLLAIVMLSSIAIPAFAATSEKQSKTPVIVIPGVTNTPVYDEDGNQIFWPDFSKNLDYEKTINALKSIMKLQDTKNYSKATDQLLDICHSLFDPAKCNADGSSVRKSHCVKVESSFAVDDSLTKYNGEASVAKTIGEQIGLDRVYEFTYDWRLDIVDTVNNELAPFVEKVKKETGSDKVVLVGSSMGGALTNTYLSLYGQRNDVKKVVFLSGAGQGVQFINDLLGKDIKIIRSALAPYFKAIIGTPGAIGISAISNYFTDILQSLIDSQLDRIWADFVNPDLLCYPAAWELAMHDKSVDKAMEENNLSPALKAKFQRYYAIQDNIDTTLKNLEAKGVEICYTSNYGLYGVPLTTNTDVTNADYLINTSNTSNGATVANLHETLGDNYKQKKDDGHNHLSADGIIDASTCYTSEKTWFIKNLVHVDFGYNTSRAKFIAWIVTHDNVDITSNPDYPQFMEYNKKDDTLTPVEKITIDEAKKDGDGYISSAVTTYTYTKLTALGWALIALIAAVVIILIAKNTGNKEKIDGVLTKKEIKALPKEEHKPAKKNNKALKKQYKKDNKASKKAHKAELKAMPKAERKETKKADKAQAKLDKKATKAEKKQAKKNKKSEKKESKTTK